MKKIIFTYEGYKNTNIGDYIQSLAAKQFVDNDDDIIYYHRDKLSEYDEETVKAIMNGWFSHMPENWPPSSKIIPLFVAFHINSSSYNALLGNISIEYLKKFEPIGCRDEITAEKLREKGVDAYFSSCLTTTLGYKYKYNGKRQGIYVVDPVHYVPESSYRFQKYKFIIYYLLYYKGIKSYILNIRKNNKYELDLKSKEGVDRYLCLIRSYVILRKILSKKDLKRVNVITQYHYDYEIPTNEERFKRAEELIEKYSKAELVITSRIHCALPCLGLETPVIFMQNMDDSVESTCRFKGLLSLINIIKFKRNKIISSFTDLPIKSINIKNKRIYKDYSEKLIEKCRLFFS